MARRDQAEINLFCHSDAELRGSTFKDPSSCLAVELTLVKLPMSILRHEADFNTALLGRLLKREAYHSPIGIEQ